MMGTIQELQAQFINYFLNSLSRVQKLTELLLPKKTPPRFPSLTKKFTEKEKIFKAPPLNQELVDAIKLISPQYPYSVDEKSRLFWEIDHNACCWAEFEVLSSILKKIPKPSTILEIGPGLGRSVIFFNKVLDWMDAEFHLYEGNGTQARYSMLGERNNNSFCGNLPILKQLLEFNGIKNFKFFDASQIGLNSTDLPHFYDLIYSFYSVGFHWSLEYYLEDLLTLMHQNSLAIFTVPMHFTKFSQLEQVYFKILYWRTSWPANRRLKFLLLSPSNIF